MLDGMDIRQTAEGLCNWWGARARRDPQPRDLFRAGQKLLRSKIYQIFFHTVDPSYQVPRSRTMLERPPMRLN